MSPARIIYVHDQPDAGETVRESLQRDPELTVLSCAPGLEALAAVRDWSPDLVLLDDMAPDLNGHATLAQLRMSRETASIPIILITGSPHTRDSGYFKALGAAGVLAKPFDADALTAAVRKHLRPKPTGERAVRKQFLKGAEAYADEIVGCLNALGEGPGRADALIHMRQIAHRLFDSEGSFAFPLIVSDAIALDEVLKGERSDAEIKSAVDALVARISSAVD